MEMEAIEHDPVTPIKKQGTTKRIRPTLTKEERATVNRHLKAKYYTLWRFMHIFFHSGSRESELMRLKKEDVNLKRQQFKVMVKKGGVYREEWRTIKDIIVPLWMEVYNEAKAGQVLFSKFMRPGAVFINLWQITRRWRGFPGRRGWLYLKRRNSTFYLDKKVLYLILVCFFHPLTKITPMAYTTSDMVYHDYRWTAYPADDPHVRGIPDSTLFNRHEGYEVLYLINKFLEVVGQPYTSSGQRAETLIRVSLPGHLHSQKNVMDWLESNW